MKRYEEATTSLDPAKLAILQDDLRSATGDDSEAARDALEEFRHSNYMTLYLLEDPRKKLDMALAVRVLYRGELPAAYLNQVAADLYLNDDRFEEAFKCLRESKWALDSSEFETERKKQYEYALHAVQAGWVYRRLGLLDRAAVDASFLLEERERLRKERTALGALSNLNLLMASIDVTLEKWAHLEDWLGEALRSKEFFENDIVRATYWRGQAAFERDRDDLDGTERARAQLVGVLSHDLTWPRIRYQAQLRLARIALYHGELEEAGFWLDESESGGFEDLQPDEQAHHAVFRMRHARRSGSDVEGARQRLLASWERYLEFMAGVPLRPGGVGMQSYHSFQRIIAEVLKVKLVTGNAREAFHEIERAHRNATLVRMLASDGVSPDSFEALPDEVLMMYLPGLDGTHLFLATSEDVQHAFLQVTGREIEQKVAALNRLVRCSPSSPNAPPHREAGIHEQATHLWSQLVPPSAQMTLAAKQRVTICGIEMLFHLPFECLLPDRGPALGLTHDISYLPALPMSGQLEPRTGLDNSLALFGGASQLEFESDWDRDLLRHYVSTSAHHGPSANESTLRETTSSVVHLLGHGRFDLERELMTTVELDGGWIGYEEIIAMQHSPRLAVITACGGWRGPERRGDGGIGHLASAFMRGGCETVVVPHADIEANATLAWSQAFHWALTRGDSPARAAREARLALVESEVYADPFYHSLLHVVGVGHHPLFEQTIEAQPQERPIPVKASTLDWRLVLAGIGLLLLIADVVRRIKDPG